MIEEVNKICSICGKERSIFWHTYSCRLNLINDEPDGGLFPHKELTDKESFNLILCKDCLMYKVKRYEYEKPLLGHVE